MTRLALFDLDGTLLRGDSEVLWTDFLLERAQLAPDFAARNAEMARRYEAGEATPSDFCAFFASTLAGRSPAQWQPLRNAFMADVIRPRITDAARALVQQHAAGGDRLVLTTATSRFLVEQTAVELGFAHLIATELAQGPDGRFTGHTAGTLNMREGKVMRLRAWLSDHGETPDEVLSEACFYSDSINDLPLMMAVGQPVAVDPDVRLRAEAQARQWPVLRLASPSFPA